MLVRWWLGGTWLALGTVELVVGVVEAARGDWLALYWLVGAPATGLAGWLMHACWWIRADLACDSWL